MRKILFFLCMVSILLSVTACGNTKVDERSGEADSQVSVSDENRSGLEPGQGENVQPSAEETVDWSASFDGIHGCAVLYSPGKNQYLYYNEDLCKQEASPLSTFKIISALLGLQHGVVNNESSTMGYDGTQYPNPEWNRNLTLKEAFQSSCIWYFRKIIDTVGKNEVQKALNHLHYGNCDATEWNGSGKNSMEELNGFWLESSLKISPVEQVQVLSKLFEGQSTFASSNIEILKAIMLANGTRNLYGKTGTGVNGNAWFIGFSEENNTREYVAVYLDDQEQHPKVSGNAAKDIAFRILE